MSLIHLIKTFNEMYVDKEEFLTPGASYISVDKVIDEEKHIYQYGEDYETGKPVYIQLEFVDDEEMEFIAYELDENFEVWDRTTHTLKFSS